MLTLLYRLFGRQTTIKPLSVLDATTGMALEMQLAQARAAVTMAESNIALYKENLHLRYDAPLGQWQLDDWAEGFVKREAEKNNA